MTEEKLPVQIKYNFNVDLEIPENLLPFVSSAIVTKSIDEDFYPYAPAIDITSYEDYWKIIGDGTTLFEGTLSYSTYDTETNDKGETIRVYKYINESEAEKFTYTRYFAGVGYYVPYWDTNKSWALAFIYNEDTNKWYFKFPYDGSGSAEEPYSSITIRRNTPEVYSSTSATPVSILNHNNVFIQLREGTMLKVPKYRLKVRGSIYKMTKRIIYNTYDFPVYIDSYTPTEYYSGFKYENSGSSHSIVEKKLYKADTIETNLKLLVMLCYPYYYNEVKKIKEIKKYNAI